jgi:HPt (histidine-containing phosphotransfer) domain-containing protein
MRGTIEKSPLAALSRGGVKVRTINPMRYWFKSGPASPQSMKFRKSHNIPIGLRTQESMIIPEYMRLSSDQTTLRSEYADDPDMLAIVALFINELPQRLALMHAALAAANMEQLRILAHQLKGAAGGYGFPKLGEAAALVDQAIKDGCDDNVIRSRVGMLAAVAARIRP